MCGSAGEAYNDCSASRHHCASGRRLSARNTGAKNLDAETGCSGMLDDLANWLTNEGRHGYPLR